ncbi:hypothetical protein GCM10027615_23890 [Plantactinospora veratri]
MNTRTVAYVTQAPSPITVISGANHQRSVRRVFAAMAARWRTLPGSPAGGGAVLVVIYVSLTGPGRYDGHGWCSGGARGAGEDPQPRYLRPRRCTRYAAR